MSRINGEIRAPGVISGTGSIYLVNHNADNGLVTLRYQLKDANVEGAEEPFAAAGQKFNRGSFIIRKAAAADLERASKELRTVLLGLPNGARTEVSVGVSFRGARSLELRQQRLATLTKAAEDERQHFKELSRKHPQVHFHSLGAADYVQAMRQGILRSRGEFVACDEIDLCDTDF